MSMSRTRPGVLTIEAAMTLPLVIIALVSILFFAKVYYIQDQIHSAMTKAVHDMSVDAYVVDQLGLVDVQQGIYKEGVAAMTSMEDASASVSENGSALLMDAANVSSYGGQVANWFGAFEGLPNVQDFNGLAREAISLIEQGPELVEGMTENMDMMVKGLQMLYQEAATSMATVGLMEAADFGNGIVAEAVGQAAFYRYLSKDQLEAWDVGSDGGYIDFSMSDYLLFDDTITLVAEYKIKIPFGNAWLGESIPVMQKVTARAWTGAYDSGEMKTRALVEEEVEQIYYISTGDADNHAYHFLSCLRKPLIKSTYYEEVMMKNREVCHYCKEHYAVTEDMEVYYVKESSKVHLYHQCYTVYAQGLMAVTEEEAVNVYHRTPCKKYHCVAQSQGEEK